MAYEVPKVIIEFEASQKGVKETEKAIDNLSDSMVKAGQMTKDAEKQMASFRDSLARIRINATNAANMGKSQGSLLKQFYGYDVNQAQKELDQVNKKMLELKASADKIGSTNMKINPTGTDVLKGKIDNLKKSLDSTSPSATKAKDSIEKFKQSAKDASPISDLTNKISNLAKAYVGFRSFTTAISAIDNVASMQGRLANVIKDSKEFSSVWGTLQKQSREMGVSLDSNVTSFAAMARSLKDAGFGSKEFLDMNELVVKSMLLMKPSAESMKSALYQLSQSFSEGKVRGQEFRTLMQQTPTLLEKVRDGLKLSEQEFRKLTEKGLPLNKFFEGLNNSAKQIREEFLKLPMTVTKAWQGFKDSISVAMYEVDAASGGTAGLSRSIRELADEISSSQFKTALYDFSSWMKEAIEISKLAAQGIYKILTATYDLGDGIGSEVPIMQKMLMALASTAQLVGNTIAAAFASISNRVQEGKQTQLNAITEAVKQIEKSGKTESIFYKAQKEKLQSLQKDLKDSPIIKESIWDQLKDQNQKVVIDYVSNLDKTAKARKKFVEDINKPIPPPKSSAGVFAAPLPKGKGRGGKSNQEKAEDSAKKYLQTLQQTAIESMELGNIELARFENAISAGGKWEKLQGSIKNQIKEQIILNKELATNKRGGDIIDEISREAELIGLTGDAYATAAFKQKLFGDGQLSIIEGTKLFDSVMQKFNETMEKSKLNEYTNYIKDLGLEFQKLGMTDFEMKIFDKVNEMTEKGFNKEQIESVVKALDAAESKMKSVESAWIGFYKNLESQAGDWATNTRSLLDGVFSGFENALLDLVQTSEFGWSSMKNFLKSFVKSAIQALTAYLIKIAAVQAAMALIGFAFKKSGPAAPIQIQDTSGIPMRSFAPAMESGAIGVGEMSRSMPIPSYAPSIPGPFSAPMFKAGPSGPSSSTVSGVVSMPKIQAFNMTMGDINITSGNNSNPRETAEAVRIAVRQEMSQFIANSQRRGGILYGR